MSDDGVVGESDNGGEMKVEESPSDIKVAKISTKTIVSHYFQLAVSFICKTVEINAAYIQVLIVSWKIDYNFKTSIY